MRALRRLNDDPDDLKARIAAAKAARKGCRDLEQRLVVAVAYRIRRELRQEGRARA
jgi:hypothetical protein